MTAQNSPIKQAAERLMQAKIEVSELLSRPELHMLELATSSNIQAVINRLSFLAGIAVPDQKKEEYKPADIGTKFTRPKSFTKEDLKPEEEEKTIFISKVERLQAQFDTLAPEAILNSYTIPEEILVVRGVAKRAGLADYETATINLHFLERIEKALKEKSRVEKEQLQIDADLVKQKEITDLKERIRMAGERKNQLPVDLAEAQKELATAKTDKEKKKIQGAIDELQKDTAAVDELIASLLTQHKELTGEDYNQ